MARIDITPSDIPAGKDVHFELKGAVEGRVTWSIDPPTETFGVDRENDRLAVLNKTAVVAGASFEVEAVVSAEYDEGIELESVRVGIVVCGPVVELTDPSEVTFDTHSATFALRGVDPEGQWDFLAIPPIGEWEVSGRSGTLVFDSKLLRQYSSFTVQVFPGGPKAGPTAQARSRRRRGGAAGAAGPIAEMRVAVAPADTRPRGRMGVTLQRTDRPPTPDQILWVLIRNSSRAMSFLSYQTFMNIVFCGDLAALCGSPDQRKRAFAAARAQLADGALRLPFPGVDPYRLVKAATEVFVTSRCGILRFDPPVVPAEERRRGVEIDDYAAAYDDYLDSDEDPRPILPYLALVLARLGDVRLVKKISDASGDAYEACEGILRDRLAYPCFIELIWSYWHEEAMLAQTMNAISQRFQNLRAPGPRDPLAQLEIDPLRPLNNLLWGYVQDEQHRLSVLRRAHEYDHHYGLTLYGKAVAELRTADVRSKFLEAFHNLLYQTTQFYRQDDDTTVIADGFPVLNAIKETHYLLAQGAHNQFGDLPSTARQEMLIEQWLLSRPEMREFLGGRVMVPYPEPWMDKVDVVKTLKGWTDVSVVHFHDLAVFGEQIVLSVRYGGWSVVNDPDQAANWARYWRPEVQGYIHGYRAVTGIDLTADITDQQQLTARYLPPSVHLRNRLSGQQGGQPAALPGRAVMARLIVEGRTPALPAARRPQLTRGSD